MEATINADQVADTSISGEFQLTELEARLEMAAVSNFPCCDCWHDLSCPQWQ